MAFSIFKSLFARQALFAKGLLIVILVGAITASYFGYLTPIEKALDDERLTFRFLEFSISPYKILKGMAILATFLWIGSTVATSAEKRINTLQHLRASNRELLSKAVTLLIYFVFIVVALDMIGVDLTAFTVVGGAIGIGIGFGLQKIASNFISGIILLAEKSIELDDLVELSGGVQGVVKHTAARYTLIETFDGKEVMVPNEDFVTQQVINWTLTNNKGRVEILIGVSYGADLDLVRTVLLETAKEHPRCCATPEPQCYLENFGDSSINFSLFFWVEDVTVGRKEPKSDVQFSIWRKFAAQGIEIPFPQRDIHIKSGAIEHDT